MKNDQGGTARGSDGAAGSGQADGDARTRLGPVLAGVVIVASLSLAGGIAIRRLYGLAPFGFESLGLGLCITTVSTVMLLRQRRLHSLRSAWPPVIGVVAGFVLAGWTLVASVLALVLVALFSAELAFAARAALDKIGRR